MTRYRNDPYPTTAKFTSMCPTCGMRIRRGEDITVWPSEPKGKKARHWACSEADYRRFEAAAADEDQMTGGARW